MSAAARRTMGLLLACAALALAAAALATAARRRAEQRPNPDVQDLARTLGIIRGSRLGHPGVLRVLFYGQSITGSGWTDLTVAHLRERYPDTVFVTKNMALGGFGSVMLARTDARDVAEFYPDLIVFHDYGDHRAYERILQDFRSLTAADVILQTDHAEVVPDLPCPEGLQMSLRRPPGCTGWGWLHQRLWGDEMSYHKLPAFAARYGLALEPQRGWWRQYLIEQRLAPAALLTDQIHPNAQGKKLLAGFFDDYFDGLVTAWNGQTQTNVADRPAGPELTFQGNRLELFTSAPLPAAPQVSVDGVAARDLDGCYQVSRTSSTGIEPDWPALRRITLHVDHTPAAWTAVVTGISPDASAFRFTVSSSDGGDQGSGTAAQPFTARSGQLSWEPDDWMLHRAVVEKHQPVPDPLEVRWAVRFVCGGEPEVIPLGDGTTQYRYVLATGLKNARHTVRLALSPADLAVATGVRTYRPPLVIR